MKRALIGVAQIPVVASALLLWPFVDWLGLSPVTTAILLLVAVITATVSFLLTRRRLSVVPSAVLLGVLLLVNVIDVSPTQPATRAVRRMRPGMLEPEVRRILRDEFPATGRFHPPSLERPIVDDVLSFVLDPNDGAYDAAVIWVYFSDGRVTSAYFDPD